jgi:hypothetical protein
MRAVSSRRGGWCTGEGRVRVSVEFPAEVLSDGVQVVSLRSTLTGAVLDRVTFLAGDALDEDIRAEVALLRDELEMLKRAFRRHVSEGVGCGRYCRLHVRRLGRSCRTTSGPTAIRWRERQSRYPLRFQSSSARPHTAVEPSLHPPVPRGQQFQP